MTADIELLPLPSVLLNWPHPTNHVAIRDYARANVAHATAPLQAEIEALRVEVETAKGQVEFYRTERNKNQRKAERLAEALRPLANLDLRPDGFDKRPDDQTIYARDRTTITVGDVRRAQAALRDHD